MSVFFLIPNIQKKFFLEICSPFISLTKKNKEVKRNGEVGQQLSILLTLNR